MIYDWEQVDGFFGNVMPDLEQDEVYFISLSARNKYLDEKERVLYGLGRTEMFARSIIRTGEKVNQVIRRITPKEGMYKTKSGHDIPDKTIVCYMNINPSSSLKALNLFQSKVNDYYAEMSNLALKRADPTQVLTKLKKLDILLMNCYQKSQSRKVWLDIDMDIPKNTSILKVLTDELEWYGVGYVVIETKSGFHVMLKRDTIKYNFNESIQKASEAAKTITDDFEIIVNSNGMVPLPGSLQAGFPVKMIQTNIEEVCV